MNGDIHGDPPGRDPWISHPAPRPGDGGSRPVRRRKYPVNEFIRPLSADSHQDDEPTSLAELTIVLELASGVTIGELARSIAMAILITMSNRKPTRRRGKR